MATKNKNQVVWSGHGPDPMDIFLDKLDKKGPSKNLLNDTLKDVDSWNKRWDIVSGTTISPETFDAHPTLMKALTALPMFMEYNPVGAFVNRSGQAAGEAYLLQQPGSMGQAASTGNPFADNAANLIGQLAGTLGAFNQAGNIVSGGAGAIARNAPKLAQAAAKAPAILKGMGQAAATAATIEAQRAAGGAPMSMQDALRNIAFMAGTGAGGGAIRQFAPQTALGELNPMIQAGIGGGAAALAGGLSALPFTDDKRQALKDLGPQVLAGAMQDAIAGGHAYRQQKPLERQMAKSTETVRDAARRVARNQGVPEDLFERLIAAESSWNPNARSKVGAIGLTQVMPETARGMGIDPNAMANNSHLQLTAGAKYLRQMYDIFGSWDKALAAYNAGPVNVQNGIIPRSTRAYVAKIMSGYNPKIKAAEAPMPQEAAPIVEEQDIFPASQGVQGPNYRQTIYTIHGDDGTTYNHYSPERAMKTLDDLDSKRLWSMADAALKPEPVKIDAPSDLIRTVRGVIVQFSDPLEVQLYEYGVGLRKQPTKRLSEAYKTQRANLPKLANQYARQVLAWAGARDEGSVMRAPTLAQVPKRENYKFVPIADSDLRRPLSDYIRIAPEAAGEAIPDQRGQLPAKPVKPSHKAINAPAETMKEPDENELALVDIAVERLKEGYASGFEEVPPSKEFNDIQGENDILKQTVGQLNQQNQANKNLAARYGSDSLVNQFGGIVQTVKDISDHFSGANKVPLSNPDAEYITSTTKSPLDFIAQSKSVVRRLIEGVKDVMSYEWRLAGRPGTVEDLRRFQDAPKDAHRWAEQTVESIVSPLQNPLEYQIFKKMIVLRDLEETLSRGENIPIGPSGKPLNQQDLASAQSELMSKAQAMGAAQRVQQALNNHDKVFDAVWQELIRRGKVNPDSQQRSNYYTHRVLDYVKDVDARFPGLSRTLKAPNRYYTKQRLGSTKAIDTDYTGVTLKQLAKIFLDNETDDFARKIGQQYDITPNLSQQQIQQMGGIEANRSRIINGEEYWGWQYGRGNSPVNLVPRDIYDRLQKFNQSPDKDEHIRQVIVDVTNRWKGVVTGPLGSGLKFQTGNAFGDIVNLFREGIQDVRNLPAGFRAAREWKSGNVSPQNQRLLQLADEGRVLQSGFNRNSFENSTFAKLEPMRALGSKVKTAWGDFNDIREATVRLANLKKNMDLIDQGKTPVAKFTDVRKLQSAGMTDEQIATKVAREFAVDYGKLTPEGKSVVKGVLFPFYTFYQQNGSNWLNYVKSHPGEAALKFAAPMAAAAAWNNFGNRKEIEDDLPAYYRIMPHIVTGFKTPQGKPIIIAMQTPADMAAKMIGLDIVPDLARQVSNGTKTVEDAAKELGMNILGAPVETAWNLLTPLFKAPIEAAMNKNTFTGASIVPQRLIGTPEDKKMRINYVLQQWIAPYGNWVRNGRDSESVTSGLGRWAMKGPADLKAAVGIREPDIESEQINRFFDKLNELEGIHKQLKNQAEQQGLPTPKPDPRLSMMRSVNARYFNKAWPYMRRIRYSKMPEKQKQQQLDNIQKQLANISEQVLVNIK